MGTWMETLLSDMNQEVAKTIRQEKKKYLSRVEKTLWSKTPNEHRFLKSFAHKIRNYKPAHEIQRKVLEFATKSDKYEYYRKLTDDANKLNEYISKSAYWVKEKITITLADGRKVKLVFAQNDEMLSTICLHNGIYIVTTNSSFKNIVREREGKKIKNKEQYNIEEQIPTEVPNLDLGLDDILNLARGI